jgi:hypothetical protein
MNTTSQFSVVFRRVLLQPERAVAGLVDDLLTVCREHDLQLDWQADHCRLRSFEGDWEELVDQPLRKSVFRAILARIAVLCNEHTPNSVSPYGGKAELSIGANPCTVFTVTFTNTTAEQRLNLTTATEPGAAASKQHEPFEKSDGDAVRSAENPRSRREALGSADA